MAGEFLAGGAELGTLTLGEIAVLAVPPPVPIIKRRGGRFFLQADREPEAIEELIELVEPEIVRKPAKTPTQASKNGPETTIRPRATIPARKKARVARLLAETGITLEELIVIIDL